MAEFQLMYLIGVVAFFVALAGVGIAIFGLWGRKVDDHPICVACGYDLFGRPPATTTCPECGADTNWPGGVRIGHRSRNPRMIVTGILLAVALFYTTHLTSNRMQTLSRLPVELDRFILAGDVKGVDRMLKAHPHLIHGGLLQKPAMLGDTAILNQLLQEDVDVNFADYQGRTALQAAAQSGRAKCVELLLQAGADPNLANLGGETPLFLFAAQRRDADNPIAEMLLDAGADPGSRNHESKTPLHVARDGHVAATLLEAGADPNARDDVHRTPLHYARSPHPYPERSPDLADVLLQHGADDALRDRYGRGPGEPFPEIIGLRNRTN